MDPNLQQELHALAQNLHDGHFTILSRGIGLGVQRKNPLTVGQDPKEAPKVTPIATQMPAGPIFEEPKSPLPAAAKALPKVPTQVVKKVPVSAAPKPKKVRTWHLPRFGGLIKGFLTVGIDLVVVLLSVASMALLVLSLSQPNWDITVQLIEITKDASYFITAMKGLVFISCLALLAYKALFHFFLGRTLGELLLSRDK